jgi:hypothetical protein
MSFIIGLFQVVGLTFAMFYVVNCNLHIGRVDNPWPWVTLVAGMCFAVMLAYRLLGCSVNIPSYTVIFFLITLNGLTASKGMAEATLYKPLIKKGLWAGLLGGVVGWLTFAEIVAM